MSQSGETIDTLAALREAQRKGYRVLAINNVVGSTIAREADGGIYQHVGPEIGVASTKAFTSQLLLGAMIALYIARLRDMSFNDGVLYVNALKGAPDLVRKSLEQAAHIKAIAKRFANEADSFPGASLFPSRWKVRSSGGILIHRNSIGGGNETRPHRPHTRSVASVLRAKGRSSKGRLSSRDQSAECSVMRSHRRLRTTSVLPTR